MTEAPETIFLGENNFSVDPSQIILETSDRHKCSSRSEGANDFFIGVYRRLSAVNSIILNHQKVGTTKHESLSENPAVPNASCFSQGETLREQAGKPVQRTGSPTVIP